MFAIHQPGISSKKHLNIAPQSRRGSRKQEEHSPPTISQAASQATASFRSARRRIPAQSMAFICSSKGADNGIRQAHRVRWRGGGVERGKEEGVVAEEAVLAL